MPTRPPRLCPTCSTLVTTPRCPTCSPPWSTSTRPGGSRAWRRLRRAVFAEQDGMCAVEGCTALADQLDHVAGWQAGDYRENVQGLCTPHHDEKTRHEAEQARQQGQQPPR